MPFTTPPPSHRILARDVIAGDYIWRCGQYCRVDGITTHRTPDTTEPPTTTGVEAHRGLVTFHLSTPQGHRIRWTYRADFDVAARGPRPTNRR